MLQNTHKQLISDFESVNFLLKSHMGGSLEAKKSGVSQGQCDGDFCPYSQGAFNIYGAAMEENYMFYNGKTEASATKFF